MPSLSDLLGRPQSLFLLCAVLSLCGASLSAIGFYRLARNQQAAKTEVQLNEKLDEIAQLKAQLGEKNAELTALRREHDNWFTGGDSFCYVTAPVVTKNLAVRSIVHQGKYPLYDVKLNIVDSSQGSEHPTEHVQIGALYPGSSRIFGRWALPAEKDEQEYLIRISARNGSLTQALQFRRTGGRWEIATRVLRDSTKEVLLVKTVFAQSGEAPAPPARAKAAGAAEAQTAHREAGGQVTEAGPEDEWKKPEKALPAFELEDLKRCKWSLESLEGKTVFINVWATWCASCVQEHRKLQKLYDRLKNRPDLALLTFNIDSEPGVAVSYLERNGYTFPVLLAGSVLGQMFDAVSIPRDWIVDANGILRWERVGFDPADADWEAKMLHKLEITRDTRESH